MTSLHEGDTGRSGTRTRRNIPKDSPIFELLGALEEARSQLTVAGAQVPSAIRPMVEALTEDLSALAREMAGEGPFASAEQVARLEKAIGELPAAPGDGKRSAGAAALEVAGAVIRRAERRAVAMSAVGGIRREVLAWLNRASDLAAALADACGQEPAAPTAPVSPAPTAIPGEGLCDRAVILCTRVIAEARRRGLKVVAAVCDAGGNPVAMLRDDDAFLVSTDVALGKAYTSVSLKMDTVQVGKLLQPGQPFYGLQNNNPRIVAFGGGVPLLTGGRLVGALGVSGGSPEEDASLAAWGAENF